MEIIRDSNEDGKLVNPSTCNVCVALWKYCHRNSRHHDWTIACKLVELDMFGSCMIYLNYDSDSGGGTSSDSLFPYIFQRNNKIMAISNIEVKDVREVGPIYTCNDQIAPLRQQLGFSSSDEEEVILEACSF